MKRSFQPMMMMLQHLAGGPRSKQTLMMQSVAGSPASFYRRLRNLAELGVRVELNRETRRYHVADWGIFNPERLRKI